MNDAPLLTSKLREKEAAAKAKVRADKWPQVSRLPVNDIVGTVLGVICTLSQALYNLADTPSKLHRIDSNPNSLLRSFPTRRSLPFDRPSHSNLRIRQTIPPSRSSIRALRPLFVQYFPPSRTRSR